MINKRMTEIDQETSIVYSYPHRERKVTNFRQRRQTFPKIFPRTKEGAMTLPSPAP